MWVHDILVWVVEHDILVHGIQAHDALVLVLEHDTQAQVHGTLV